MIGVGAIDIARIVNRDAFQRIAGPIRNVGDDLAVIDSRDANPRRKPGIARHVRCFIGDIQVTIGYRDNLATLVDARAYKPTMSRIL